MTCYVWFECSHWLKLQHSDWRANLVNFPTMRSLEFITGHVMYNLAYTYKFQLKTTQVFWTNWKQTYLVQKCLPKTKPLMFLLLDILLNLLFTIRNSLLKRTGIFFHQKWLLWWGIQVILLSNTFLLVLFQWQGDLSAGKDY